MVKGQIKEALKAVAGFLARNHSVIILAAVIVAAFLLLSGCRMGSSQGFFSRVFGGSTPDPNSLMKTDINAALQPLVWTGALCIPVGVVTLFITKLERGWIFIGFGIGLCVLSWLLSMLAIWIMLIICPIIIVLCLYYGWSVFKSLKRNGGVLSHWKPKEVADEPVSG